MTGLAQKGGAVQSHVRIAPPGSSHAPTRIPPACVDTLIGADAVTAASRDVLRLTSSQRTTVILDRHVAPTAEFVIGQRRDPGFDTLAERLRQRAKQVFAVDANTATRTRFGSTAYANIHLLGYAFPVGDHPGVPRGLGKGDRPERRRRREDLAAFHLGRAPHATPACRPPSQRRPNARLRRLPPRARCIRPVLERLDEKGGDSKHLPGGLPGSEPRAAVREPSSTGSRAPRNAWRPSSTVLTDAVAESYFKLLAVKDEYEVARLYTGRIDGGFAAKLADTFEPGFKATYHFAPPFLARPGPNGRPRKIAVGRWIMPVLHCLAKLRWLRGTSFDPFRFMREAPLGTPPSEGFRSRHRGHRGTTRRGQLRDRRGPRATADVRQGASVR